MDEAKRDSILDDLKGRLEEFEPDDADSETWPEIVEDALGTAWDALLKLVPGA
jgi:hypothetical protein